MQTSGKGGLLNKRFGLQDPTTLITTLSSDQPVTFSHLRVDSAGLTLASIPAEAAYSIHVHLRDTTFNLRVDGRSMGKKHSEAGCLCFFDLQSPPDILFDAPFRTIRSHVPIPAIQELAEEAGARRQVYLEPPQPGTDDAVLRHLFTSLLPILVQPEEGNSLFVDHIALALQAYLLQAYGTSTIGGGAARRGLAPWQERRAKEAMNANLAKDISIADLARELGLSSSHFARAFRQATGRPPHRWLLERRVETAQHLLLNSTMTLKEIAIACGFTDQSTFTRAFTRLVGTSPAAWRRLRQG